MAHVIGDRLQKAVGAAFRAGGDAGRLFALEDGRVLEGPSTYPQTCFDVRTRGGQVEVRARG